MNFMTKALEAFKRFRDNAKFDNQGDYYLSTQYINDNDIIETALKSQKNQKRKLEVISEVLVSVSKGNYADLNRAIDEIRGVIEDE